MLRTQCDRSSTPPSSVSATRSSTHRCTQLERPSLVFQLFKTRPTSGFVLLGLLLKLILNSKWWKSWSWLVKLSIFTRIRLSLRECLIQTWRLPSSQAPNLRLSLVSEAQSNVLSKTVSKLAASEQLSKTKSWRVIWSSAVLGTRSTSQSFTTQLSLMERPVWSRRTPNFVKNVIYRSPKRKTPSMCTMMRLLTANVKNVSSPGSKSQGRSRKTFHSSRSKESQLPTTSKTLINVDNKTCWQL